MQRFLVKVYEPIRVSPQSFLLSPQKKYTYTHSFSYNFKALIRLPEPTQISLDSMDSGLIIYSLIYRQKTYC